MYAASPRRRSASIRRFDAGAIGLGLILLGVALIIAWIVLPFAIIGTKSLLRDLLEPFKPVIRCHG